MCNSVPHMKTSLCANVQLNRNNFDFNLKSSLTPFFHRALQLPFSFRLVLCLLWHNRATTGRRWTGKGLMSTARKERQTAERHTATTDGLCEQHCLNRIPRHLKIKVTSTRKVSQVDSTVTGICTTRLLRITLTFEILLFTLTICNSLQFTLVTKKRHFV